MKLADETRELFEELEVMFNQMMNSLGGFESIKDMDDDSLIAFKNCLKLMDKSKNYSIAMAAKLDKIDSIDEKLDKLLKMRDKA